MGKKINIIFIKKVIFSLVIILILFGFYKINDLNYNKHKEINANLVNHPEGLPTKEFALQTSFGYKNLRADLYWLETIQYIGGNAISSEYKKYLFKMLDLITELNPFFEHPYNIGELLLPEYNPRYENLTKEEQEKTVNQGIEIGLKGLKNFCDLKKVEKIKKEIDLTKIRENPEYKDPCKTYSIPYYLAYIYFYYKKDNINASNYYKVASANRDSVEGAKTMAAIMQGKGGNRGKSFIMFLNLARSINKNDEMCVKFSYYLEQRVKNNLSNDFKLKPDGKTIMEIQGVREEVFGKFNGDEKTKLSDTDCSNYANKAVRELNMAYIENGNNKFREKNNGRNARNAKALFNEKYIDFLPTDFQQYSDYGIIYEYDVELKRFDYKMGKYDN